MTEISEGQCKEKYTHELLRRIDDLKHLVDALNEDRDRLRQEVNKLKNERVQEELALAQAQVLWLQRRVAELENRPQPRNSLVPYYIGRASGASPESTGSCSSRSTVSSARVHRNPKKQIRVQSPRQACSPVYIHKLT